ncbi:MAG TPA: hypothetical protein VMH35_15805 [Streptosporangiaceae bacterium]|nr:hypothetical protein [Streptosporangiaceae bacterium]
MHILGICNWVTGNDASLQTTTTADGIRVSFPSRRAAWTAVNALGRVGYTAAHASGDRQTWDVVVTGWNANRLDSRLNTLRTVMHGLADNPLVSATAAVRRFAALPKAAASPAAATEILEETRQQLRDWADARAGISVPFPPGRLPDDSAIAMRVRAASTCEQVVRDLIDRHMRVAGYAMAEFASLRQQMNDSRAQRTAVRRAGAFFHLSPSSVAQDSAPLMSRSTSRAAPGRAPADVPDRPQRPRRGTAGEFPSPPGVTGPRGAGPAAGRAGPGGQDFPAARPGRHL